MRNLHLIIICCALLISIYSKAQSYTTKHLGIEDGLSNNYVLDIMQDGKGFIWIATESGLNRFDGYNFTTYRPSNSSLISDGVSSLLYNKQENSIWIGTPRDGISIFDCVSQQFKNYTVENGLVSNDVTHLAPAHDGGIWITHYYTGIEHYNPQNGVLTLFSNENVKGLKNRNGLSCDDGRGNLYIGHTFYGLSIVNIRNKTVRNFRHNVNDPQSLPGNDVHTIYMDHFGRIWIGTSAGLALFNPEAENFVCFGHTPYNPNSLPLGPVYDICETHDNRLWITTDNGMAYFLHLNDSISIDPLKTQFYPVVIDIGGYTQTNCLLEDSFGNLWLGYNGEGINFISNSQPAFHTLSFAAKDNKLKKKPIWNFFSGRDEQLWIGSDDAIAVIQNNQIKEIFNISNYRTNSYGRISAIKQDKQGNLWLGMYNEDILILDPDNKQPETAKLNARNNNTFTFFEYADGEMWVGTKNGIYSCRDNLTQPIEIINKQIPDEIIYSILRDREEKLWIVTFGSGIFIFDKNHQLADSLSLENGFCSNSIQHIYMDSKGQIWIATRNGVACVKDCCNPRNYELYTMWQGLPSNYARAVQEDMSGNIWISTNEGISFWNKQKELFENYDYRDGVPRGTFIEGAAGIGPDGTLYFGSLDGVCYFKPQELSCQYAIPPVQIIGCEQLSRQVEGPVEELPNISSVNGKINLTYDQNSFRIIFAVPNYSLNQHVEYAYMIKGVDNVWYNTQGDNQITFRNIPPGEYTFKVKARLRNKDWDEAHVATMAIHIHPPFWLTWYAKLLYIIAACFAVFVIFRFYKRRLDIENSLELERRKIQNEQELNNERLRFYTNIAHELRTPLTLMIGPLEDLVDNPNQPDSPKKISLIHSSALRLLNLINQLLDFRKTETRNRKLVVSKGDLGSLITEIGLRYKELNQNHDVAFYINIEAEETMLYFDPEILTTILDNLLSNAVKYTSKGKIGVIMRSFIQNDKRYTEIAVKDTGHGISPEALPHIFDRYYQAYDKHQALGSGIGLALVKSLTELHEGMLHVESVQGEGSLFAIRLLTDNTYPHALHKEEKDVSVVESLSIKQEDEAFDKKSVSSIVILVVEDNDDIREYIASTLSSDYKIITATNGEEGLEIARKQIPNIIVSDIMMPGMDGIELCRAVKEDVQTSHIPVILLTAKDSLQDKEEGYSSGADSYLTKPFSANLLQSRIRNLLVMRRNLIKRIAMNPQLLKVDERENSINLSKLDEEFLAKLNAIIEENMQQEKIDVVSLAEQMNMSHSTFYRKVKGLAGVSAQEFVRKVRLEKSRVLLASGKYNVSEVAYMTGFNHLGHFREYFIKEFGIAPSDYKKMV